MRDIRDYLDNACTGISAKKRFETVCLIDECMRRDICHFTYRKNNGEIRDAYGTRLKEIIERYLEEKDRDKGKPERSTGSSYTYFDLERLEWRSFNVTRVLSMDENYTL